MTWLDRSTRLLHRHAVEYSTYPRGPRSGPGCSGTGRQSLSYCFYKAIGTHKKCTGNHTRKAFSVPWLASEHKKPPVRAAKSGEGPILARTQDRAVYVILNLTQQVVGFGLQLDLVPRQLADRPLIARRQRRHIGARDGGSTTGLFS